MREFWKERLTELFQVAACCDYLSDPQEALHHKTLAASQCSEPNRKKTFVHLHNRSESFLNIPINSRRYFDLSLEMQSESD